MRLNDFIALIRKNSRIIPYVVIGALLFSIIVGFTIGMVRRSAGSKAMKSQELERIIYGKEALPETSKPGLLVPPPVVPELDDIASDYFLYFDQPTEAVEEMEMLPVKISELIKYRKRGLVTDLRPFYFMGEELDILTKEDEIAEP